MAIFHDLERIFWATRVRRIVSTLVVLIFVFAVSLLWEVSKSKQAYEAARAELEREAIDSHEVTIAFEESFQAKALTFNELVRFTATGLKFQHGIKRHLWSSFEVEAGQGVPLQYDVEEVWLDDARSKAATLPDEGGFKVVAYGDSERTLPAGPHAFTFRYQSKPASFARKDSREGFIFNITAPIGLLTRALKCSVILPGYAKVEEVYATGRISIRNPETQEVLSTGELMRVSKQFDPEKKRVVVSFESAGEILPGGFGTVELVW